ncbi:MAG: hypothetical protein GY870_18155 [archaeon]|nr:hypothetical protein [archaeon]
MVFNKWNSIEEIEEDEGDYFIEENSEEDAYEDENLNETLEELKNAVFVMKDLLHSALEEEDEDGHFELPAEIFADHIKISWDSRYTGNIKDVVEEFITIQQRLKEINAKFVELKISKYRYELLKDILVAKMSHQLQKILKSVY